MKEIDKIKDAQKEADDVVNLKVEATAGVRDVIGADVMILNDDISTKEEALEYIKNNTDEKFDIVKTLDGVYAIRTVVADLNKVNVVDPSDLDTKQAIPIQIKLSKMLSASNLNISVNDDDIKKFQENIDKAQAELIEKEN